jgi:transposase
MFAVMEAADMSKALSFDLRERVVASVEAGATHREAAERFGVSAASVSRWRARARDLGSPKPKALGGDRRFRHVEKHAAQIVGLVEETPDMTIHELKAALGSHGLRFGYGTLQRFLIRHGLTRKKRLAMQVSKTARTS